MTLSQKIRVAALFAVMGFAACEPVEPRVCNLQTATVLGTAPNKFLSQCMNGALNTTVQLEDQTVRTLCLTADKGTVLKVCL